MLGRNWNWNSIRESIGAAIMMAVTLIFSPLLRLWYTHWGATESESARYLPGDEFVSQPRTRYTRAITIDATPEQIWPWLAQIGQGKGGLYSYEALENLVGCDIHNADHVLPHYQRVKVGDRVRLGPKHKGYPFYWVAGVKPNEALVLASGDVVVTADEVRLPDQLPAEYTLTSWVFYLQPITPHSTRLLERGRLTYEPNSWKNWFIWRVMTEPIAFVMERKMLLEIKRRAEAVASIGRTPARAAA